MNQENIMIKKCIGCGAILQYDDENKVGYIPENKYSEANYCKRCFRLTHYDSKKNLLPNYDNKSLINLINSRQGYVFFLADFFNLSEEVISTFKSITLPKTMVINKSDLITRNISLDFLKSKISKVYSISDEIIFISGEHDTDFSFLFRKLDRNRVLQAFILGYTNTGKSTFINKLKLNKAITTSNSLNTTIDLIDIKIDKYTITDTPGFTLTKTFYKVDDSNLIKRINPKYYVKARTYQVKLEQIYCIEDSLFFICSNYNSFTFYISNLINIKKLYKLPDIKLTEITINANSDLVIKSLGFIHIKKDCTIKVNSKMIDLLEVRSTILGGLR